MSDHCKVRFTTWIPQKTGGSMLGEVVVAEVYDAAQAELAALREELDECKKHQVILLKGAQYARSRRDYWIAEGRNIFERLTASEQRNSDLVALLECVNDTGELTRPEHEELEADICAAVKAFWDRRRNSNPIESGASE